MCKRRVRAAALLQWRMLFAQHPPGLSAHSVVDAADREKSCAPLEIVKTTPASHVLAALPEAGDFARVSMKKICFLTPMMNQTPQLQEQRPQANARGAAKRTGGGPSDSVRLWLAACFPIYIYVL